MIVSLGWHAYMSNTNIIEVENIVVNFGDVNALDGVSLNVAEGEVRGLLGPNGAGKTTLVNVIATLLKADSGVAKVAGFDVVSHGKQVRSSIGLAGQYAAVDELLTGRENLEIVGSLYQLSRSEAKIRANETLERLSLTEAADRLVRTYSGGMRRRLDLGACLVGQPKVLILDEPTTGLDPRTRIELWGFLQDLVDGGTTVLLTTQYLEEADLLADQITVIDKGKVIAEGTADDLKDLIGGANLVIAPTDPTELNNLAEAVSTLNQNDPRIDEQKGCIYLSVDGGAASVVKASNLIEAKGVALSSISLERPTLDEVFLKLTEEVTQ